MKKYLIAPIPMNRINKLYNSVFLKPIDAIWFALINLLLLMVAQYIHAFHYNIIYLIDYWKTGLWEWYVYESTVRPIVKYISFLTLPHILMLFYLKYKIMDVQKNSLQDPNYIEIKLWKKASLLLMLPGEILRYILCITQCDFVDKGADSLGQGFAPLFNTIFLQNYLKVTGYPFRSGNLPYVLKDYIAYTICWLLFFGVYFCIRMIMFKIIWIITRDRLISDNEKTTL